MASDIVIRKCDKLDEFHRCVEIQREIWGETDLETEPYVTFVVASQTGGQVLGAFDGENIVGFTLALVGYRDRGAYMHSHMTGVLPAYRDRRVGRMLKLYQREEALHRGLRRVEWTFDPLEVRNAHFNFNRLGGISRHLIPNFYGVTTSPLHRGLPTDRLLVEWHLETPRVVAAVNELLRQPAECGATVLLPKELDQWTEEDTPRREAEQTRMREELQALFAKGYAVTGVRFSRDGAAYCLAPWSEF